MASVRRNKGAQSTGCKVLMPQTQTADAVWRSLDIIEKPDASLVSWAAVLAEDLASGYAPAL
jgi:hypothetical protein